MIDQPSTTRGARRLIAVLTTLTLPVLVDLLISDRRVVFRYFAADAFYYHTVARNFANYGFPSFDQVRPINGFHPLWQTLLAGTYWLTSRLKLSELTYLYVALLESLGLVAFAVWFLGRTVDRVWGRIPPSFSVVVLGPIGILGLPLWWYAFETRHWLSPFDGKETPNFTLWAYTNGMESGLAMAFFASGAFAYVALEDSPRRGRVVGALVGGMILARLDHALVGAAMLTGLALEGGAAMVLRRWRVWASAGAAAAVPLLLYVCINRLYAQSWLPVSGAAKSTFPKVTDVNVVAIKRILHGPWEFIFRYFEAWRALQLVLPMLVAVVFLAWWMIRMRKGAGAVTDAEARLRSFDRLLLSAGAGVLALGLYNFLFVPLMGQGHWYFPISSLWLTLVFVRALPGERSGASSNAVFALVGAATIMVFGRCHRQPSYHQQFSSFYFESGPRIREMLGKLDVRMVEYDDGIIAFTTGFPCAAGFGFALDTEASGVQRSGGFEAFVQLMNRRGFNRIASLTYYDPRAYGIVAGRTERPHAFAGVFYPGILTVKPVVEFLSSDGRGIIIRIDPLTPAAGPTPSGTVQ